MTQASANQRFSEQCRRLIKNFMDDADLPPWYRGISAFQKSAANSLFGALRDDAEQETTHRTHQCLKDLGLDPVIKGKAIKLLMRLSRNNDLAFLWFLLESHYKTKDSDRFSLNEQLIMSAITHLDLIPTLRELDRVLPPGVEVAKKEVDSMAKLLQKRQLEKVAKAAAAQRMQRQSARQAKNVSPYEEKLKPPKPYGRSLYIKEPVFRVKIYDEYKNALYVVQNMSNRWFATHKPHTSQRIVNTIVKETMNDVFRLSKKTKEKAKKKAALTDESGKLSELSEQEDTLSRVFMLSQDSSKHAALKGPSLCAYHRRAKELESNLKKELLNITDVTCRKIEEQAREKDMARLKRIRDELERNVDCYLNQFRRMTGRACCEVHRVDTLQLQTGCHCYYADECEPLDGEGQNATPLAGRHAGDSEIYVRKSQCSSMRLRGGISNNPPEMASSADDRSATTRDHHGSSIGFNTCCSRPQICECFCQRSTQKGSAAAIPVLSKDSNTARRSRDVRISVVPKEDDVDQMSEGLIRSNNSVNGSMPSLSQTASQTFLKAATEHSPWQFDYFNIFKKLRPIYKKNRLPITTTKTKPDMIRDRDVKCLCLKALDDDGLEDKTMEPILNYDDAIRSQVKQSFRESSMAGKLRLNNRHQNKLAHDDRKTPLTFDRATFDPDDKNLMEDMLKRALKHIARDKRYVLASIPDAYKLPILKHFIGRRYGRYYTNKERQQSLQESLKVFRALDRVAAQIPIPNIREMGQNDFVSYDCRDYLLQLSSKIKADYYRLLNQAILDQARIFWFAMRPFLCTGGPPRNTFYAYMPSRPNDISRFNIWKPSEYRNARQAWEDRLRQKRKRLFK